MANIMSRTEYAEYVVDCMTEDEIQSIFGMTAEDLAGDGWNEIAEFYYNSYYVEEEYACKCSCQMGGCCDTIGCDCINCPID